MQRVTALHFPYAIAEPKVFTQNFINAIVFKLQVILPILEGTEKSQSSDYSFSYWDMLKVTYHVVNMEKVAE